MKNTTELLQRLTKYRQDLHRIPELGYQEHKTRQYIYDHLSALDCRIIETKGTGLCAFFRSKNERSSRKTIAYRSDMDGLPITEVSKVPYASTHPGKMHACGHDGHMAMLLAFADYLSDMLKILPNNVLLIFQPAEETSGGAEDICRSGILETFNVARIFGFHLWPSQPAGSIASRPGPIMAKSNEVNILIKGESTHCSTLEKGVDALYIGCKFLTDLYAMEQSILPREEFRLLKFGRMESGTVRNAISGETVLNGTLRCYSQKTFDRITQKIRDLANDLEAAYGCNITVSYSKGYPPMINDSQLFELAKNALEKELPFIVPEKPFLSADDFSYYLERIPGVYFFLGTGLGIPLHSDHFVFDESILVNGVKTYLTLLTLPL